jgi:type II secretory ATPase GspE/PulE/Tfp pilus assembly ATPase PilB-like protein
MSERTQATKPSPIDALRGAVAAKSHQDPAYATDAVDLLLRAALTAGASDVHLQPTAEGLDVRWRVDGVLHPVVVLPAAGAAKVVARLKVLADLLTYRHDVPQEGRIRTAPGDVEMRVSTFPTLYGEKVVVRAFAGSGSYQRIGDLGLPPEVADGLRRMLAATSGAILFSGPAGSGKTTTLYACLRDLVATTHGRRSLASLEDPIEVAVPGVAQSQVNPGAGFTLETGLRSILRQDPEVIAVGEIRDRPTAEVVFQASLTGHLVLSTFHAGGAAAVVGRLSDMGIEPYLLRSGILAVVGQRLVRRLCACAREGDDPQGALGLAVARYGVPVGCALCGETGYRGRMVLAEMLVPEKNEVGRAILSRSDVARLEALAVEAGMVNLWERARRAVEGGLTSPAEVRRVLGIDDTPPANFLGGG